MYRIDPALANADSYAVSVALAKLLSDKEAGFDVIFTGKEAVDDGAAQVPSRLAAKLDIALANVATGIELADGKVSVTREIDGGTEDRS